MSALSDWLPAYNTLVVLAGGGLLGCGAGVIGCFALLKKRALTGDALAHASLPGLCIGFLLAGERSMPALFLGALGMGVVGITVLALLRRWTRIKEDAALGIVLSVAYGLGIVLLSAQPWRDEVGLAPFLEGRAAEMRADDVYFLAALVAGSLVVVVGLFKEFRLISFDPAFAQVQGWPTVTLDFVMMSLVVMVVVIGLPAVGVLLMAALLIIPPAAARLWTERLGVMTMLGGAFGLSAGLVGVWASATYERVPAGPAIILSASAFFFVSLIVAPRRGLLARWFLSRRIEEAP
jgi:manganese/zinc/iron transport system permease protein